MSWCPVVRRGRIALRDTTAHEHGRAGESSNGGEKSSSARYSGENGCAEEQVIIEEE